MIHPKTKSGLCLTLLFLSLSSFAQDDGSSAYAFGGACASQGTWTQNALSTTQTLRRVALRLRDDKNCRNLQKNNENHLLALEQSVQSVSDSPRKVQRLSEIPDELGALRSFGSQSSAAKKQVLRLMLDRSIEKATISSDVNGQAGRLMDFGSRVNRSTSTGIALLNQVVADLPRMEECLVGDKSQIMGTYIASAVKIAAAFGSSNESSIGSKLATTISKLTEYARDQKFAKALRKLNQQEFMTSMSCLMEISSLSYCQARDAMGLFKEGVKNEKNPNISKDVINPSNPFSGQYVLNTHVPNITKWIQKVQVGVDPKLPTDAEFQNKINQEVTDFFKKVKTLLGDYNSKLDTIKKMSSLEQKQNAVLTLLLSVTEKMIRSGHGDDQVNFFTMAKTYLKIPFFLIGMDTVPDQVSGVTMPQLGYDQWLTSRMNTIPAFNDPIALAETIRSNMNLLIREANIAAIEYYNHWYIVDKPALVNESLVDMNYTVKGSLRAIQIYLEVARKRIVAYKGDATLVPTIDDTNARIGKILQSYNQLEAIGENWKRRKSAQITAAELQTSAIAFDNHINTVFEELNVLHSKSGFLANRMVNIVYNDYILLIKNRVDFTPYQEQIFISEGMAAFDRMIQLYNGNRSDTESDLKTALQVNSGNLYALEKFLKDSVAGQISEFKMIADGVESGSPTFFKNMNRIMRDIMRERKELYNRSTFSWVNEALKNPVAQIPYYWYKHSDRYTSEWSGREDEYGSAQFLYSKFCIQALAFPSQIGIESQCREAILKGPYEIASHAAHYDRIIDIYLKDKRYSPTMRKAMNFSNRVCAYNDHKRRVMVHQMQLNKKGI